MEARPSEMWIITVNTIAIIDTEKDELYQAYNSDYN
jgi:hypothetical protein